MKILATSLALCMLLAAPAAYADMYVCKDRSGRTWFTNEKKKGYRCRLAMKFQDGMSPSKKASAGRSGTSFTPPKLGQAPRAVEEKGSVKERIKLYQAYIDEASAKYRIPVPFIKAIIRVESNFRYRAESSVGAMGLMQLMPRTARAMGVNDAWDPRQNILGGTRLLRVLANRHHGDIVKVLSAYHAGSGAVAKKGGIPYQGTEGYVRAVLDHYYRFKASVE